MAHFEGDLDAARAALSAVAPGDERFAVVRICSSLSDGSMPAGTAQQALIRLMRRDRNGRAQKNSTSEASSTALSSGAILGVALASAAPRSEVVATPNA